MVGFGAIGIFSATFGSPLVVLAVYLGMENASQHYQDADNNRVIPVRPSFSISLSEAYSQPYLFRKWQTHFLADPYLFSLFTLAVGYFKYVALLLILLAVNIGPSLPHSP